MYGDDDDNDPRGDVGNYILMNIIELESSIYEKSCRNDLWMKIMEDEINSIKRNIS